MHLPGETNFDFKDAISCRRRSLTIIRNFEHYLDQSKQEFEGNLCRPPSPSGDFALEDFIKERTIGICKFGRIMLVKNKDTSEFKAMKILSKSKIHAHHHVDRILREKTVLNNIDFPFIIGLNHVFKDNSFIYFIMPFIHGGEMFTHLRNQGHFEQTLSQFYASQVLLALEYLHNLNLVHRDIKPENILIDSNGYIKLIDFEFCKVILDRSYTLCGTPDYLAPEMLLSQGHGKSVDWWQLGVLIFEMLSGYPPFQALDNLKTYSKILSGHFYFPYYVTRDARDLIRNLLQVDMTKRFGNLKDGVNDVKNHRWFQDVRWLDVLNQNVEPPFIPRVKSPCDTSNFDAYDEEILNVSMENKLSQEFIDF